MNFDEETQKINFITSDSGMLEGFNYHDKELIGILKTGADNFDVYLSELNENQYKIRINSIFYLIVSNFWEGNIINSIFLWPLDGTPLNAIKSLFKERGPEDVSSIISDLENSGAKYVFAIECSYGAMLYAACKSIEVNKVRM